MNENELKTAFIEKYITPNNLELNKKLSDLLDTVVEETITSPMTVDGKLPETFDEYLFNVAMRFIISIDTFEELSKGVSQLLRLSGPKTIRYRGKTLQYPPCQEDDLCE